MTPGPMYVYENNMSIFNNTSKPKTMLKKKSDSVCYHAMLVVLGKELCWDKGLPYQPDAHTIEQFQFTHKKLTMVESVVICNGMGGVLWIRSSDGDRLSSQVTHHLRTILIHKYCTLLLYSAFFW